MRASTAGARRLAAVPTRRRWASSSSSSIPSSSLQYCLDLLRRYDRQHLLCTTLLPATTRIAAQVVAAFNVEISLIDRHSSNSNAVQLRLQWWREVIATAAADDSRKIEHPVVEALTVLIHEHRFPVRWLNQIVDSRDTDQTAAPATIADLEALSEASRSSLLYLTLHSGKVHDLHADHAASHIGKAIGLTTALQAIRFGYTTNLPRNLLQDPHLKLAAENEPLTELVYEIASQAKAHLDHARSLRDAVPGPARPVLLPAVPAAQYLDQLEHAQFDVFRTAPVNPVRTQLSLLFHRLRSRF